MSYLQVYLATAFPCATTLAIPYAQRLECEGSRITHKWWAEGDAQATVEPGRRSETLLAISEQRKFALDDLRGVETADLVWVLAPETGGTGCWIELGYALAWGKPCVVSGPPRTIFATHPKVKTFHDHEAAFATIAAFVSTNSREANLRGWGGLLYDWLTS